MELSPENLFRTLRADATGEETEREMPHST